MTTNREIFNKYRAVTSADSLPPYESPSTIAIDNMGTMDFLFELLKQTKGQEGLKDVVLKSTLSELNNNIDINTIIVNSIKDTFFCLFDIIIPEDLTIGHTGFFFNVSEIDPTNMLSIDPNSPEGRFIYEGNDVEQHMNYAIYSAFSSPESNPLIFQRNVNGVNTDLFSLYYAGGNQMKFHFGESYANQKLSEWAEDYMQDMNFFNLPNFLTRLVDIITGVVSVKVGKKFEAIQDDSRILQMMQKLFGFCKDNQDSGAYTTADNTINEEVNQPEIKPNVSPNNFFKKKDDLNNITYDTLFDFTPDELLNIENITDLRNGNKVRFSVCGNFDVNIDADDIINKMGELFDDAVKTTKVTLPDGSAEVPEYNNEDLTPNMSNVTNFLTNIIPENLNENVENINNTTGDETGSVSANDLSVNIPTMEAEFELGVIKAIPYALVQQVISPQLLLLIKASRVVIGEEENEDAFKLESVMKNLGKLITAIGDEIWNQILKNIFNVLKKDLLAIINDLATKYLSQRFMDYIGIITFLINLIKGLVLSTSGCNSMLDTIMRLLSLNYFGPALPVPPPLVYAGGFVKPGLNHVSVVNDLKSSLSDKGLEVGAYMSDGTPNYLMAALEETTKTIINHIKLDSKIDIMTVGTTGPSIGYGQIS